MKSGVTEHLLQQYPAWREAIREFFASSFKPGDVVSFDWLYTAFLIDRPGPRADLASAQKAELHFLTQFKAFEEALLRENQIALSNVRGVGYRIVPPAEQSEWAERQGVGEIRKAIAKMGDRLTNVDLTALSADQRRQNADSLARLAHLSGMAKHAVARRSVMDIEQAAE